MPLRTSFLHGLPPNIPRRVPIRTLPTFPKVYWADVGIAFTAGLVCAGLGFIGALWLFGG